MERPEAPDEVDRKAAVITSILQTRKMRLREVVNLAKDTQLCLSVKPGLPAVGKGRGEGV